MMVYLASDRPLPLIPWNESAPAFHVRELGDREQEQAVRRQFSKPHVRYAGAHEGCGCGFVYGRWPAEDDPSETAASRESMRRLIAYLQDAVRERPVELFVCWDGDQGAEPEHRATVTPAEIAGEGFRLEEKQYLSVVADAARSGADRA